MERSQDCLRWKGGFGKDGPCCHPYLTSTDVHDGGVRESSARSKFGRVLVQDTYADDIVLVADSGLSCKLSWMWYKHIC